MRKVNKAAKAAAPNVPSVVKDAGSAPRQRLVSMTADLQEFMYKEEDGSWNADKSVTGSELIDLVGGWLQQLDLAPVKSSKEKEAE